MAIKTVKEILDTLNARTKDSTDDETLNFIGDVSDTLKNLEKQATSSNEWEQKYKDNDAEWRQKYRDRFFSADGSNDNNPAQISEPSANEPSAKSYDDLFAHNANGK